VLYTFTGLDDGGLPAGGLVFDAAGNLYGATNFYGSFNAGTIFELSPSSGGAWTLTTLHEFTGDPDGAYPIGNLIFDAAGNLYGTTYEGGTGGGLGPGTIFELSPGSSGWTEAILYNFTDQSDGGFPLDGVIMDASGNLYGTTSSSEPIHHNYGVAYELSPGSGGTWTQTVLHHFANGTTDGQYPYGGLVFDKTGALYGTTNFGGTSDDGTVFKIVP
jgi:uncharacterized repeat protein (TIGR03803 family)